MTPLEFPLMNNLIKNYPGKNSAQAGFTLLELMSVVAIAGILMSFALPAYRDMTRNNCMTTKANALVSSFQLARSEAVKRQSDITISAMNNNWNDGWTVSQGAQVIRVTEGLSCIATTIDNAKTEYAYDSRGFILDVNNDESFDICDDRTNERGRQITITTTGRPSIDIDFACS